MQLRDQAAFDAERSREAAESADESAHAASEAAGTAGVDSLAHFFDEYAKTEATLARKSQTVYIILLAVGTAAAITLAAIYVTDDIFSAETAKLSATLPVYLLAANYARLAGEHRATARRAREIAIRLKTLTAYGDVMDSAGAAELRLAFGLELFSVAHLARRQSSNGEAVVALPVLEAAERILDRRSKP